MPSMTIRLAKLGDARAIAGVHVAAWRAAYADVMPRDYLERLTVEGRTADWERWLREPGPGTTVVCEHERRIIGFCVYGPTRDDDAAPDTTGELVAINLHPRYWRQGWGTALCRYVVQEAESRGWQSLTLWVLKQNLAACGFYARLGFVPDGTERRDTTLVGASLDELRYRISLPQARC